MLRYLQAIAVQFNISFSKQQKRRENITIMAHILLHTSRDVWNVISVAPVETSLGPNKELKGFIKESCSESRGEKKRGKNSKYLTVPLKNAGVTKV